MGRSQLSNRAGSARVRSAANREDSVLTVPLAQLCAVHCGTWMLKRSVRASDARFATARFTYRPVSTYRWWARRTEAVNGSIIDAVSADKPGRMVVSDPFAGGGVIPLAAVMRGHSVYAQDLNPWAAAGLASMLALPTPRRSEMESQRSPSAYWRAPKRHTAPCSATEPLDS